MFFYFITKKIETKRESFNEFSVVFVCDFQVLTHK
jgi:hypothetical protein